MFTIKKTQLDELCEEIEILCLGSSYTYYGINPVYFSKKAYNAANPSQTWDNDQKILEKYIPKMPALQQVVLSVSYFSFFQNMDDNTERWRKKNYSISMEVSKPDIFDDYLLFGIERQELIPTWLGKIKPHTMNDLGFGTDYTFEKRSRIHEKKGAVLAKRYTLNRKRQEEMKGILEDMIRLCASRNITVVLFISPLHHSYREHLDKEQLDVMYSLLHDIKQKHANVILFNASSDSDFEDDDFYDADHLNDLGAEKFTKKLDQFLQN